MNINELATKFSTSIEDQKKVILCTLFIAGNRIQTLFDGQIPEISLKQFMLLAIVRKEKKPFTLTQLGEMMGCSRQNIKKLAEALEQKGYVILQKSTKDARASYLLPTERVETHLKDVFAFCKQEMNDLFQGYTDKEIMELFRLMYKLYEGIDRLEEQLAYKDD